MRDEDTRGVLFEVLSGEDGCGDHFFDPCCTLCKGWRHLIECGYMSHTPEHQKKFYAAFRARKRRLSGWDAQVEADAAERGFCLSQAARAEAERYRMEIAEKEAAVKRAGWTEPTTRAAKPGRLTEDASK